MTDQEISEIASRVLRERFPDAGLIMAEAKSDLDYEGTPILKIMARFQHRPLVCIVKRYPRAENGAAEAR